MDVMNQNRKIVNILFPSVCFFASAFIQAVEEAAQGGLIAFDRCEEQSAAVRIRTPSLTAITALSVRDDYGISPLLK